MQCFRKKAQSGRIGDAVRKFMSEMLDYAENNQDEMHLTLCQPVFWCELSCELFMLCVQKLYCFRKIILLLKTAEIRINKEKAAV